MRQASRRSWRIGQESDVEVHFLCYAETLQATALALMKAKIRTSLMLEGELPEGGLAGDGADEDLFLQMARKLAVGRQGDGLEELFADTHEAELQADRFLAAAFLDDDAEVDEGSTAVMGIDRDPWPDSSAIAAGGQLPLLGLPTASEPPVIGSSARLVAAIPPPVDHPARPAAEEGLGGIRVVSWEELATRALAEKRTRVARVVGAKVGQLRLS